MLDASSIRIYTDDLPIKVVSKCCQNLVQGVFLVDIVDKILSG